LKESAAAVPTDAPRLPQAPAKPQPDAIPADTLTNRIDKFLATRGLGPVGGSPTAVPLPAQPQTTQAEKFVCEDDVRLALKEGRKLLIGERTIVTPAARDAGESAKVFVYASWPQP